MGLLEIFGIRKLGHREPLSTATFSQTRTELTKQGGVVPVTDTRLYKDGQLVSIETKRGVEEVVIEIDIPSKSSH